MAQQPEPRLHVKGYLEHEIRDACERGTGLPTAHLDDRALAESGFRAAMLALREITNMKKATTDRADVDTTIVTWIKAQTEATVTRSQALKQAAKVWIPVIAAVLAALASWLRH